MHEILHIMMYIGLGTRTIGCMETVITPTESGAMTQVNIQQIMSSTCVIRLRL